MVAVAGYRGTSAQEKSEMPAAAAPYVSHAYLRLDIDFGLITWDSEDFGAFLGVFNLT